MKSLDRGMIMFAKKSKLKKSLVILIKRAFNNCTIVNCPAEVNLVITMTRLSITAGRELYVLPNTNKEEGSVSDCKSPESMWRGAREDQIWSKTSRFTIGPIYNSNLQQLNLN